MRSSPPARRCPRGPGTPLPARRPGCSRGMAAGPLSPAAGSAEPVSSRVLAASASPCGGHYLRVERGGGGQVPGRGAQDPVGGGGAGAGAGLQSAARDRPEGARGGVAPSGSGLSVSLLGSGRGTWSSLRPEGRFCEWEGPGVGSMETPGSPAHCVAAAAVVVAAAAQCPARGTPWRGEAEREDIPAPRGASVYAAGARAGVSGGTVSDLHGMHALLTRHPVPGSPAWVLEEKGSLEQLMTQRSFGEEGSPTVF